MSLKAENVIDNPFKKDDERLMEVFKCTPEAVIDTGHRNVRDCLEKLFEKFIKKAKQEFPDLFSSEEISLKLKSKFCNKYISKLDVLFAHYYKYLIENFMNIPKNMVMAHEEKSSIFVHNPNEEKNNLVEEIQLLENRILFKRYSKVIFDKKIEELKNILLIVQHDFQEVQNLSLRAADAENIMTRIDKSISKLENCQSNK